MTRPLNSPDVRLRAIGLDVLQACRNGSSPRFSSNGRSRRLTSQVLVHGIGELVLCGRVRR